MKLDTQNAVTNIDHEKTQESASHSLHIKLELLLKPLLEKPQPNSGSACQPR